MKLKTLLTATTLALSLAATPAQALQLPDRTIGCPRFSDLQELLSAVINKDIRLFSLKLDDGCFTIKDGLEYSILDESYGDSASSWTEIKVYSGDESFNLYVSKRHLNK